MDSRAPEGYRLAHAQKAISIIVKHLWCHDLLPAGVTPDVCPVDRIMLTRAGARLPFTWTQISSLAEYCQALDALRAAAGATPLAVWELAVFSNGEVINTAAGIRDAKLRFLTSNSRAAAPGSDQQSIWSSAISDALRSSHNRASLYHAGVSWEQKQPFLADLRRELKQVGSEYEAGVHLPTQAQFEQDTVGLTKMMNARHRSLFR